MAGKTTSSTLTAIWIALGTSTTTIICGALLVVVIILSLIPLYIPNHSEEGFGDEFLIKAFMLKSIYSTSTATGYTFSNSPMADNTQLSAACSDTYKTGGQQNIAGCVVEKNLAFGPGTPDENPKRRRRQGAQSGLYTVGAARLFYSTTCGANKDKEKNASSSGVSSCVLQRLNACNGLFSNSSSTFLHWKLTSDVTYLVIPTGSTSYIPLTIRTILGIPPSLLPTVAQTYPIPQTTQSDIRAGCQYKGPVSHSIIAAAIGAQSTMTTTLPSSTLPAG